MPFKVYRFQEPTTSATASEWQDIDDAIDISEWSEVNAIVRVYDDAAASNLWIRTGAERFDDCMSRDADSQSVTLTQAGNYRVTIDKPAKWLRWQRSASASAGKFDITVVGKRRSNRVKHVKMQAPLTLTASADQDPAEAIDVLDYSHAVFVVRVLGAHAEAVLNILHSNVQVGLTTEDTNTTPFHASGVTLAMSTAGTYLLEATGLCRFLRWQVTGVTSSDVQFEIDLILRQVPPAA